jgi:hypothetical protein
MNGAAQIRRCSGALCAIQLLLPAPNPKISNRESLRLELDVTQTKQTTQPHSNRELEALFSNRVRAVDHLKSSNRESRTSIHQSASPSPRKLPTSPKNNTTHASVLLRLKSTPTLCFVGVTDHFNRTLLRLSDPISTSENTAPMQTRRNETAITAISTPQSLFRLERTPIPCFQELTRDLNDTMFRLEMKKGGEKPHAQTRRVGHPVLAPGRR